MSEGFHFLVTTAQDDFASQRVDLDDWSEAATWAEDLASTGQHFDVPEAGIVRFIPPQAIIRVTYRPRLEAEEA